MSGLSHSQLLDQSVTSAIEQCGDATNVTLAAIKSYGCDFGPHRPVFRAAQVVIAETYLIENPSLSEEHQRAVIRIREGIRTADGMATRIDMIRASLYGNCQERSANLDQYLSQSVTAEAMKLFVKNGQAPVEGLVATRRIGLWVLLFCMTTRGCIAEAIKDSASLPQINGSLTRIEKALGVS